MENNVTHAAMDTHKEEHNVALHCPGQEEIVRFAVRNTARDIAKMVKRIGTYPPEPNWQLYIALRLIRSCLSGFGQVR